MQMIWFGLAEIALRKQTNQNAVDVRAIRTFFVAVAV